MNHEEAEKLIKIYGESWVKQDPDLITTIFTDDATYNDPYEPENVGIDAIRNYWIEKVVKGQKDITFNIKNIWIDGYNIIAEWTANFIDTKRNLSIEMQEVAIFTVRNNKFSSLREYYKTKKTPL